MPKKRKIPLRKCVVTQEMLPKQSLIRIVKTSDGDVFVDPTGKKNGRGAYISKDINVVEKAKQSRVLEKNLEIPVSEDIYDELKNVIKGV